MASIALSPFFTAEWHVLAAENDDFPLFNGYLEVFERKKLKTLDAIQVAHGEDARRLFMVECAFYFRQESYLPLKVDCIGKTILFALEKKRPTIAVFLFDRSLLFKKTGVATLLSPALETLAKYYFEHEKLSDFERDILRPSQAFTNAVLRVDTTCEEALKKRITYLKGVWAHRVANAMYRSMIRAGLIEEATPSE